MKMRTSKNLVSDEAFVFLIDLKKTTDRMFFNGMVTLCKIHLLIKQTYWQKFPVRDQDHWNSLRKNTESSVFVNVLCKIDG